MIASILYWTWFFCRHSSSVMGTSSTTRNSASAMLARQSAHRNGIEKSGLRIVRFLAAMRANEVLRHDDPAAYRSSFFFTSASGIVGSLRRRRTSGRSIASSNSSRVSKASMHRLTIELIIFRPKSKLALPHSSANHFAASDLSCTHSKLRRPSRESVLRQNTQVLPESATTAKLASF